MRTIAALILGLLVCGYAMACSCAYEPLTSASARKAPNVFVFRLLAARAEPGSDAQSQVTGQVLVLANVRGRTTVRAIHFSRYWCCGIRMEVGRDYIGFMPADAQAFDANGGNVLALEEGFGDAEATRLEAVLRGREEIQAAFAYGFQDILQMRPPPPPCPAGQAR